MSNTLHQRTASPLPHEVGLRSIQSDAGLLSDLTAKHSVLVVDDDVSLGKYLSRELRALSFAVKVQSDGQQSCRDLQEGSFDLVILDLNLGSEDGLAVMKQMRLSHPSTPILVLTARNRTADLVQVLDQGADDYLVKPFSFLELRARMKNLLRRHSALRPRAPSVSELTINPDDRSVFRGSRRIDLTPREFAILSNLMANSGKSVSRMTLMNEVWNIPFDPSTNIVDVYMKYLRDKIDQPGEKKLIRTIRGVGYVLSHE